MPLGLEVEMKRRSLTPIYAHRRVHPVLRRMIPKINRKLGLDVDAAQVPVWWVPQWVWRDLGREAGFDEQSLPMVRAFAIDGEFYVPENRAWYSVLHETLHAVGLDDRLGGPWVIEGLTEAVEHELGRLFIDRLPTRGPYAVRKDWTRRVLVPATGHRDATGLARTLLASEDPLGRLVQLLVEHNPGLDAAEVTRQLGPSNEERPVLGLAGEERFGLYDQDTMLTEVKLEGYGSLAGSALVTGGLWGSRAVRDLFFAGLPARIWSQLRTARDLWEGGDQEGARHIARRAAGLMKRLHRKDPDHILLHDALEVANFASGQDTVPRFSTLALDPDRLPVPSSTARWYDGGALSASGQRAYRPDEAVEILASTRGTGPVVTA